MRAQFETHENLQFYPTPASLALEAWSMFTEKEITRLLEPSAGRGDLVQAYKDRQGSRYGHPYGRPMFEWDAVEIEASHHPLLRERGAQVVGYDFLAHTSCAIYSHIIMNPPFAQGARHVLHAWETLYEGEIVAIINAETLRNQCSVERTHLARIVAEHGEVRFIENAFQGDDVYRSAKVEIALVHLTKRAATQWLNDNLFEGLSKETGSPETESLWQAPHELALPTGFVEETVRNFNIAVDAAKGYAKASALFGHYRARLGKTFESMQNEGKGGIEGVLAHSGAAVRATYATTYSDLKSAAWAQILRSTHVLSRLSNAARHRVESEFENIKALEFTTANVYGFLAGLVNSAGEIQMGMICDVFDLITRYHSDNTVYFMGWKSNDKHRTVGRRVKRSRFILPSEPHRSYRSSASFETVNMLKDFDRVFAMLDGKAQCVQGLSQLFDGNASYQALVRGERLSSDYFDVRYYRRRGTIHFFPRNKEVIERLNRTVGKYRNWIPPADDHANADWHTQYEQAEKFCAEIVDATVKAMPNAAWWGAGVMGRLTSTDPESRDETTKAALTAIAQVLAKHNLHPQEQVTSEPQSEVKQLRLVA